MKREALWEAAGLVSTDWLALHLDDENLRIFDATAHLVPAPGGGLQAESGRRDYEIAHLPGAAFLDLPGDLSDRSAPFRFTMPPLRAFARAMGEAGLRPGLKVVLYSATSPMWATRVWWMLRASGFDSAAVLDGGLKKWRRERRPVEAGARRYPRGCVEFLPVPGMWADKAAVLAATGDHQVCLINALPAASHAGIGAPHYARAGHIKGSCNLPYEALLDGAGCFRPDRELRALFQATGAFEAERVICYCGGGIAATSEAPALVRLGHPSVAVYDGSLVEWSRDATLPMELGGGWTTGSELTPPAPELDELPKSPGGRRT